MNQKNGKNSLGLDSCFEDLDNPIEVSWKKTYPNILNENLPFKKDFFETLNSLGINL